MLVGEMNREQIWLLPRTPDEPVPPGHPTRFAAEGFCDGFAFDDQ